MKRYTLLIVSVFLLLTNHVQAVWNEAVKNACLAIADPSVTATPEQVRLAWLNNRDINMQALAGNPDLPQNVYNAVQTEYNNLTTQYINELNNRRPDTAGIQTQTSTKPSQAGTDTDLISSQANTPAEIRDLHNELNNIINEDMQKNGPADYTSDGIDHLANNDIDIMGDVNNPNVTPENFNAMNAHTQGSVYNDYYAAKYEYDSRNTPGPPSISGSGNYVNEMMGQIQDKQNALKGYLKALAEAKKFMDNNPGNLAAQAEYNTLVGKVHQCNAQIAKYVERVNGVKGATSQIADGYNLPASQNPSLQAAGADRTPGNYNAAAATGALSDNLIKNGILDYSELLGKLAEQDPSKAAEVYNAIAKGADNLSDAAKSQLLAEIEQKFGSEAAKNVVAEMKNPDKWKGASGGRGSSGPGSTISTSGKSGTSAGKSTKPTTPQKTSGSTKTSGTGKTYGSYGTTYPIKTGGTRGTSFKLTDTNPGKFGAGINAVGNILTVIDVIKTGQTMWNQAVEDQYGDALITGGSFAGSMYVGMKVGGLAMTYLPNATLVVGAGMTAYDATTRIMDYVTVDGKNLNEHVQDKIEENVYVSSQYDTEAVADMQDLFKYAIKSGAYVLPPGMTTSEGWQAVVKNMDEGRTSIFDGILVRPEPLTVEDEEPSKDDKQQAAWEQAVIDGKLNPYQYEEFLKYYDPNTGTYTGPAIAGQPVAESEPDDETEEQQDNSSETGSARRYWIVVDDETGQVEKMYFAGSEEDLKATFPYNTPYLYTEGVDDYGDVVGSDVFPEGYSSLEEFIDDQMPCTHENADGTTVPGVQMIEYPLGGETKTDAYTSESYFNGEPHGIWTKKTSNYRYECVYDQGLCRVCREYNLATGRLVSETAYAYSITGTHDVDRSLAGSNGSDCYTASAYDGTTKITTKSYDYDGNLYAVERSESDCVHFGNPGDHAYVPAKRVCVPLGEVADFLAKQNGPPEFPSVENLYEQKDDDAHQVAGPDETSLYDDQPDEPLTIPEPDAPEVYYTPGPDRHSGGSSASTPSKSYDDLVDQALAEDDAADAESSSSSNGNGVFDNLLADALADQQNIPPSSSSGSSSAKLSYEDRVQQALGNTGKQSSGENSTYDALLQDALADCQDTPRSGTPATSRGGNLSYADRLSNALYGDKTETEETANKKDDYAARVAAALNTPSSTRHAKSSPTPLPNRKTPASSKPSTQNVPFTYAGTYQGTSVSKITYHKTHPELRGLPQTSRNTLTVTVKNDGTLILKGDGPSVRTKLDKDGSFTFRASNGGASMNGSGRISRSGHLTGKGISKDSQGVCTVNVTLDAQKK